MKPTALWNKATGRSKIPFPYSATLLRQYFPMQPWSSQWGGADRRLFQPGLRPEQRAENQQRELRFCKMRHHPDFMIQGSGQFSLSFSPREISSIIQIECTVTLR
eukprot:superscaffoldBa00000186_g2512